MANLPVVELVALLTDRSQYAQNRMRVAIHEPGCRADSKPLSEQFDDLNHLSVVKPKPVQRLRFAECFPAADTTIPLDGAV